MRIGKSGANKPLLLAATALTGALLFAGCDEHITVIRDPEIRVVKGSTWAWRPLAQKEGTGERPVVSRDVISRGPAVQHEPDANRQIIRDRFPMAIEQTLSEKGLRQVSDPQAADFLEEYHVAVRRHDVTVEHVYPGGYPGVVCGPYGCWESWGWGPPVVGYENVRFREGTVVVDLVKQSTRKLAYRAIGDKPVRPDTFNQGEVTGFVRHMLGKLKVSG